MFKKISLFNFYRRTIKECEKELAVNFRLEKDLIYRLYTIVNIDPKLVEQYYTEDVTGPIVTEYVTKVHRYMSAQGLGELVAIREVKPIDAFNVRIVIGFSLFDTARVANRLIVLSSILLVSLIALFIIF